MYTQCFIFCYKSREIHFQQENYSLVCNGYVNKSPAVCAGVVSEPKSKVEKNRERQLGPGRHKGANE